MNNPPEIKIIDNSCKSELKEKSSRFLGFAFPVEKEGEVLSNLEKIKKEFYDASHHCYAYKLIDIFKYSDAGEPSGTAGIRILNAIEHFNLVNTLVIVVRYFGGTKLGVGRLGRAYYDSALNVLEKAEVVTKLLYQKILITTNFDHIQKIHHLFKDQENKILKIDYSEKVNFECLVKPDNSPQLIEKLKNLTNGKINIIQKEIVYS